MKAVGKRAGRQYERDRPPKIRLRASGAKAPEDMLPGEYIVKCDRGEIKVRGNQISAVLTCSVLGRYENHSAKQYEGVVLKQWYALGKVSGGENDITLDVSPHSKYGAAWSKATGRSVKPNENPTPKAFEKKIFRADVGFRSNSGGTFSYKNLGRKKDEKDFLRIHSIIEKIEEKAVTHMTPYGPNETTNNEHEHKTQASTLAPAPAPQLDHRILHFVQNSHMNNEQRGEGHHGELEAGRVTKASPEPPNSDDLAEDWDEAAILRTKNAGTLEKIRLVKQVFPGAKVIQ